MATSTDNYNLNINVQVDASMKSLGQIKAELRSLDQAMTEAQKRGDSITFNKLSAQYGILKNDMVDLKAKMKALDPGEILSNFVKMGQGMVGSFAAVTGAMTLFGVENEKINEIQKKSMAIIQTMIGLESFRATFIDAKGKAEIAGMFKAMDAQLKKLFLTKAQIAAEIELNAVQGKSSAGLISSFSLIVLGATAAVGILGGLVYAMYNYNDTLYIAAEYSEDWKKKNDALNKSLTTNNQSIKDNTDWINNYLKKLKDTGKTEGDIAREKLKQIEKERQTNLKLQDDKIKNNENEIKTFEEERRQLEARKGFDDEKNNLTLNEQRRLEAVNNSIVNLKKENDKLITTKKEYISNGKIIISQTEKELEKWEAYADKIEKLNSKLKDKKKLTQEEFDLIKEGNKLKGVENKLTIDSVTYTDEATMANLGLKKMLDAGLITQEEYNAELEASQPQLQKTTTKTDELTEAQKKLNEETKKTVEVWDELSKEDQWAKTNELIQGIITMINDIMVPLSDLGNSLLETEQNQINSKKEAWDEYYNEKNEKIEKDIEFAREKYGEDSNQYKNAVKQKTNLDNEKLDNDKKIKEEERKMNKKAWDLKHSQEIIDATIDLTIGIMKAFNSGAAYPFVGPATGAVFAALAAGIQAANLAVIVAQKNPYKRRGGLITGLAHEQGGETINAEGGEVILNANSMRNPGFRSIANQINMAGGGVPIPNIGVSNSSQSITSRLDPNDLKLIAQEIAAIPVYVTETDITKAQTRKVLIAQKSSIS